MVAECCASLGSVASSPTGSGRGADYGRSCCSGAPGRLVTGELIGARSPGGVRPGGWSLVITARRSISEYWSTRDEQGVVTMPADDRLRELGLTLPDAMRLPPGLSVPFQWVRVRGDRAYISGHGALSADGSPAG